MKTISAYVNVALEDYDESVRDHVIELMKESLREQSDENILELTWKVEENKRKLFKNEDGKWESDSFVDAHLEPNDIREMLEIMTIIITVEVESNI